MDYSGIILDELRKTNFTLERIARTLIDIETLLERNSSVGLTLREAVQSGQDCPLCGGNRVILKGDTKILCPACTVSGQS